jgi:DNA-binding response OmpR family regulator
MTDNKPILSNHILIVDDDRLTTTLISAVLSSAGHQVTQASSGLDALMLVGQHDFALALLDINMPGMSGLELGRQLKAESTVPFMFLSANKDEATVKQGVEYGAIGFLVKPIDAESLIPAVTASLARAADIRALRRSEANLTSALAAGRENSIAVGLLMARYHVNRDQAFTVLREFARSNRRKLSEVATELLEAEEIDIAFRNLFAKRGS